jgi:hypothetical protein
MKASPAASREALHFSQQAFISRDIDFPGADWFVEITLSGRNFQSSTGVL